MGTNITKGCPQGSCCGPIFWNNQYDPVLNLQYTHHIRAVAFADDLIVMIRADNIRDAEKIANVEMDIIAIWAGNDKTKFNEEKSKVMLMTRRISKEQKEVEVYMNNNAIPQVQTVKYLGIIFDCKLFFREHINYVADKCTKLIFQLAKSAKLNWGSSHKTLQTIYLGGIQPLLTYGAPIWIKSMRKENYKARLLRVLRLTNVKMAKAYGTVSHEALCVLAGMMPIDIKIEEDAQLYQLTKCNANDKTHFDKDTDARIWQHPAEASISSTD
jgi:hypothetical protein